MNYRAIQPVSIWTETGFRNASRLRLSNFGNYNFDGGGGNVNWYLDEVTITTNPVLDAEGNPVYHQVPVLDEQGNPTYEQVAVVDEMGNPVLDENGNPTYQNGNQIFENGEPMTTETINTSPLAWSINPMNIPSEVVQQWGEDDTPIFEYVASQLSDINIILL